MRPVVVAQLIEPLLLIPEVRGSNLVIGKNLYWTFTVNCIENTRPRMAHFLNLLMRSPRVDENWCDHSWFTRQTIFCWMSSSWWLAGWLRIPCTGWRPSGSSTRSKHINTKLPRFSYQAKRCCLTCRASLSEAICTKGSLSVTLRVQLKNLSFCQISRMHGRTAGFSAQTGHLKVSRRLRWRLLLLGWCTI